MAVNWALGLQQENAGQAFGNAFKAGMEQNRQATARQAMATLVKNPNDPTALAALAKVDPETALKFRQQNIENLKAQLGEHADSVVKGAQIFRQFNPQDQQSYTQALAAAQQAGIDISQVPQQYNPEYVQGVIKVADALKPEAQDPGIIREFDEATHRGLVPQGTSFTQYVQMRSPSISQPVTVPYGATVTGGGTPQSAPVTATGPDGHKIQFNPQTNSWEPIGGQTAPSPSGGFPRPY